MIKQHNRFGLYYIQNNQGLKKCYQLRMNNFVQGEFKQKNTFHNNKEPDCE